MTTATKRYVFLGCGDMAREIRCLVERQAARRGDQLRIVYYVDDVRDVAGRTDLVCQDLDELIRRCPPGEWKPVSCVGIPEVRRRFYHAFRQLGYEFDTIVSDRAIVETSHAIAEGSIIFPGAVLAVGTRLGKNCAVYFNAVVGHDCEIGDHSVINPGANLAGRIVGGEAVLYGIGATILQGCTIGAESIVAAGSAVLADVPPRVTMLGVPARPWPRPEAAAPTRSLDAS
jgi:sugar O-acyltransferase (sialic acid O-acetyltransferase NeuD family)